MKRFRFFRETPDWKSGLRWAVLAALVFATAVFGAVPKLINFQGILRDGSGNPVANGSYSATFTIYDAAVGGTNLWSETQSVTTTNGLFTVQLGTVNPVPDSVFKDTLRWLGIAVSPDPEMTPRQQLVSVAYGFRISSVDGASGGNITSKVSIGPGHTNTGADAFVAGNGNTASGAQATVPGGLGNTASGDYSFAAGVSNTASNTWATVSGGHNNNASGLSATIGGGAFNTVSGSSGATVAGGNSNTSSGTLTTVGGGGGNTATGIRTTVGGGFSNYISGISSTIGGGESDTISGNYATIAGGGFNVATGYQSAIAGGQANRAAGHLSAIGGGLNNFAGDSAANIGGGRNNQAKGKYSTVGGGGGANAFDSNSASGNYSTVGGGQANSASGLRSTIAGGFGGLASGELASVGGGIGNLATGLEATIAGGFNNYANGGASSIGGGVYDSATGSSSTVSGGQYNKTAGNYSSIGGGSYNKARGAYATVSGGGGASLADSNSAFGDYSTVGGGRGNVASGSRSTVAGGHGGLASGGLASVGGGIGNLATGLEATIAGGFNSSAAGAASSIGGGVYDSAMGSSSTVPGGEYNLAGGNYSFAAGRYAKALHTGSFVWADQGGLSGTVFASTGANQFLIRADGGAAINTNAPYADANTDLTLPGSIGFKNGTTPMMYIYESGISNSARPIIAHSPGFPDYGLTYNDAADQMIFQGSGTPRMTVNLAGVADILDVDGNVIVGTGTTGCVKDADGTVIAGTCSSDQRLKTKITPFPDVLEKLIQLRPVHFYWKADEYPEKHFGKSRSFGLIAQEVEKILPDLVTEDEEGFLAVRYNKLPLLLLQAVKEQQKTIADLRNEVGELKQLVEKLLSSERKNLIQPASEKVGMKE